VRPSAWRVTTVTLAAPVVITSVSTEGDPVSFQDLPSGISAQLGTLGDACPMPETTGRVQLVVNLQRNDGGYVAFRYRYRSWDWGSEQFTAAVYPQSNGYWPSTLRQAAFPAGSNACAKLQDTGWITAVVYVFAIWEAPGYPNDVAMRFSVENDGFGDNTYVEIADIVAICATEQQPAGRAVRSESLRSFVSPAPPLDVRVEIDVRRSENDDARYPARPRSMSHPVRIYSEAECRGCCVAALTPIPTDDPDSAAMEAGYSAAAWRSKLTDELQTAEASFKDRVQTAGGVYRLTSTYRTWWYQQHLREVWDKWVALKNNTTSQCATLKGEVTTEKETKHGLRFQPAGTDPRHVRGEAIDVKWKPADTGLAEEVLLQLADECNLWRRVPRDKVHFEVKPAP
jgi:hypothetical protein